MKNRLMTIPLLMILFAYGCEKHVTSDCLQVKIIRITCASKVMQVLNNSSVGEDGWKDIYNNNVSYDNVFSASNGCHIPSEYKVGDVLYITIGRATMSDCVQCALYDAPPKVSYEVKTMGNLPCSDNK